MGMKIYLHRIQYSDWINVEINNDAINAHNFAHTTTLSGPSEVNTRIYSPKYETLYSLRSLG